MRKKEAVSDNQTFVALVQVARQDAGFREQLFRILSLDNFNRKSALSTLIHDMGLQKAPKDLVVLVFIAPVSGSGMIGLLAAGIVSGVIFVDVRKKGEEKKESLRA